MSTNVSMTQDFLDKSLKKLKYNFVTTKEATAQMYEKALEEQKELVLSCILERTEEFYNGFENAKANIKDPIIRKNVINGFSEMDVDKMLVFSNKSLALEETIELAISYGLMLVRASREECVRARLNPWDIAYRLVGKINLEQLVVSEEEGEIHA